MPNLFRTNDMQHWALKHIRRAVGRNEHTPTTEVRSTARPRSCARFGICLGILASICFSVWGADQRANAAPPEWLEIKAAFEKRRAKSMRHEYQVECVAVHSDPEDVPEETAIEGSFTYKLDLENKWFRLDQRQPLFSETGPVPDYTIYLHDSKKGVELRPERRPGVAVMIDFPDRQLRNQIATARPLFWPYGIINARDFQEGKITDLSDKQCQWKIEGNLIHVSWKQSRSMITWTLDRNLDFQIVGFRKHAAVSWDGKDLTQSEMDAEPCEVSVATYTEKDGGYELSGWTYNYPGFDKRFRITRHSMPESMNVDDFRMPPDYLESGDLVSKEKRFKVVSNEGTLVPWKPGNPLPVKNRNWLWWSGALVLALAVHLLRRIRNSRSVA